MMKIGITGGIGSGKSTVCRLFAQRGIAVYDSDREAKRLMTEDAALRAAISARFGAEAYTADGALNRGYLASRVFTDSEALADLDALVHPAVKADFAQGTIGVRYLITNGQARRNNTCVTDLCFVIMDNESVADREEEQATNSYGWSITLTPNASHTLALLKELGALDDTHIAPTFAQRETYGNEAWQDW